MTLIERLDNKINEAPNYLTRFEELKKKAEIPITDLKSMKQLMDFSKGELGIETGRQISMNSLDRSFSSASHFITDDFDYI